LKQLWRNETAILEEIYGNYASSNSFNMFFLNVVMVPPNRFRPESKMGDERYLHDHTIILTNVIKINRELKVMIIKESFEAENNKKSKFD
jgi:DNA-directed RNA polymerase I subunit RPA1